MPRDFLITSFGLKSVRTQVYQKQIDEGLPTDDSGDFPAFDVEASPRMDVGSGDAPRLTWMGTPVWADLILKINDSNEGVLLDTILLEVSHSKNIIQTFIPGKSGSVKEYINDGDFVINAKGLFANQNPNEYPTVEVNNFLNRMRYDGALIVVSPFLQLFNIYNIVITDFRLIQQEGFQNTQLFEFNALSDEPFEFTN